MRLQQMNAKSSISNFIILQDNTWLEQQRIAGRVVAGALQLLENAVKEKTTMTMLELNNMAEQYIEKNDCSCTFKNYKGFPCGVCISVNTVLVHGIPNEYRLQEGDKVSFDLGATYNGAIADSALTCFYGEAKEAHTALSEDTKQSLYASIKSISIGKKIGSIGDVIYKTLKDKYDVVVNYGGHGLSRTADGIGIPHAQPFIPNRSSINDGVRAQIGMTIAIEPQATIRSGNFYTKTADDGWSVMTPKIGSHWEHSMFLHSDHIEIITHREGEDIERDIYFK
jgi:methionyl aminopeptidase